MEESDEVPFIDTDDMAINKAFTKGIVKGKTDTLFIPDAPITREEIMVMMIRMVSFMEEDLGRQIVLRYPYDISKYYDATDISDWALEAVILSVQNDLVKGVGSSLYLIH